MLVTLTLLFLYWLVVHALFVWVAAHWFNVYVTALLAFLYLPSYLDGKEYTGERQWRGLREWRLWTRLSPVDTYFFAKGDLDAVDHSSMRLYVLVPGKTLASMVWGIGLHGGALSPFGQRLHFVVPPLLMAIPLLRDVLLWMGAVTWHPRKLPLTELILNILQSNRSLCFCPSQDAYSPEAGMPGVPIRMDMRLFDFALHHHMQMVPVVLQNEERHYRMLKWPTVQRWTHQKLGYAWPQACWPKRGPKVPRLKLVFGGIFHCEKRYSNPEALAEAFCKGFGTLSDDNTQDETYRVEAKGSDETF